MEQTKPTYEQVLETMDPQQREFFELLAKKEKLHPDLVPYLQKHRTLGVVLKHPLYFEMFYNEERNALINKGYLAKLDYANKKLVEGNYSGYIWMFERPHRIEKFIEIMNKLSDEEYWELLGDIWTDSENLWQYASCLGWLLRERGAGRENMMNEKEQEFLAGLPETFTIYRGHQGSRNRFGWSWSLSYFKARWFAERFDQRNAAVIRGTINKNDVIACFNGRNEFEIVVDPNTVRDVKTVVMKKNRKPWVQAVLDEAWDGYKLRRQKSYHGLWHWLKVERNAFFLAKNTPEADKIVCQLFALIHDSKRENEDDDPEHGDRAAVWVEKLHDQGKLPITIVQRELLTYACRLHEKGQTSDNSTIGVCWDADRLDLTRVGIIPDPKLLSTKAGKEMVWNLP